MIDSEKIFEQIIGRILGKGIEVREIIIIMIELGIVIGQETGILQGVMEGIETLTAVDLDQDPEQTQIGTELDAMCVENTITLLEIVLILERRET